MAEDGRKSRIVSLGPFRAAMAFGSGLAAFGSFAPDTSLQSVDIELPTAKSGLDALAGDFARLAGDMRAAGEHLGGRTDEDE